MGASAAIEQAKRYLYELTGKTPEAVSAFARCADCWNVELEVVELERIPQSTDILATYRVQLDDDGELICCERVGRYYRNQTSREE